MIDQNDWRLTSGPVRGREEELKNIPLYYIPFRPWTKQWDHEHCVFCWAKFYLHPECLQEGYCTRPVHTRDADWICPECYQDFKELFRWRKVEPDSLEEAVARIRYMEECFDGLTDCWREDPAELSQGMLGLLRQYYEGGQWLRDFELDERELLPPDLKRGVLAEDAVYNFLAEVDSHAPIG